jgi:mono/diheme cytochrome c family protein
MKLNGVTAMLAVSLTCGTPAQAQSPTAAPDNAPFSAEQLFATTCGWCHSDGGRAAGKGPQLMDTKHDGLRRSAQMRYSRTKQAAM